MRRSLLALLLLLPLASSAPAGVPCTLPFNLQNGTPADATQVMANYNALVSCLQLAAVAGANNDITSLTALTTPIAPAQGGTPIYTGGVAGGSANAITVNPVVPGNFTLQAGRSVVFVASANNTGPVTLSVGGSATANFYRRTQVGLAAMVGGELIQNEAVTAYFDGTQFQLMSVSTVLIAEIKDWASPTPPAGWALLDGSCQSRTGPMATLFVLIGTVYDPTGSTCDSANFALPDARGRVLAGLDTLGTRLTVAGSGCNGATLGAAGCGAQTSTIAQANLPVATFSGSATSISGGGTTGSVDLAHTHGLNGGAGLLPPGGVGGTSGPTGNLGGNPVASTDAASVSLNHSHTFGFTGASGSASVSSGGSGTPLPVVQPTLVVQKIIKY